MSDESTGAVDRPLMNRNMVVLGAVLIQLCLGAIYAWSVFTPALSASNPADVAIVYGADQLDLAQDKYDAMKGELEPLKKTLTGITKKLKELEKDPGADVGASVTKDSLEAEKKTALATMDGIASDYGAKKRVDELSFSLSKAQTQAIFAAGLAFFAIVMVIAGRIMPKVGPRKLAVAGGVVLGLGYALAGLISPGSFWTTFLFVGVVGGSGIGLAYVVPIAVGMRWFPDKKGLITGLAVAGFGFGALLWVKLAGDWGSLIANSGLGGTFLVYGLAFLVAVVIGGIWMVYPPEGYKPAGWEPPVAKPGAAHVAGAVDFTSGQMLATPQFYMIFLCFVFGASAGLMSIGLMKLWPIEALTRGGMEAAKASAVAGTAMAVFFSLANGIGRIAWGTMSDKLGRKPSIVIMMATQGVFVILFQWMAGSQGLLYLAATLIGFNFGGNFALFPTITADTFGTKHVGQNYGWVFLAYGIGGIFGPMVGGSLGDMGNFPLAFSICGGLCLVAAVLTGMVRPPQHPEAVSETAAEAPEAD